MLKSSTKNEITLVAENQKKLKDANKINETKKAPLQLEALKETDIPQVINTAGEELIPFPKINENHPKKIDSCKSIQKTLCTIKFNDISKSNNFIYEALPFLPVVSLLLIILGWKVIYNNAKKIATRNENKSLIDNVVSILNEMEILVTGYWLSTKKNRLGSEEYQVICSAKLLKLNSRLSFLYERGLNISDVDLAILSEHMTLNCERVNSRSNSNNREQAQLFLEEVNKCINSLYANFQIRHKPA